MMKLRTLPIVLTALAAGPLVLSAGEPTESASENFRLSGLVPNGGQATMASERFRMKVVISPPPDCEMESQRFRIFPVEEAEEVREKDLQADSS